MTVYAFPSITPSSSSVELITNTRTFQSPITGAVQTVGRKGSMWKISMKFNNLSGADRATMKAFLTKLNGQEHRMYLNDHSAQRRGSAGTGDTLLVNGASQTGQYLLRMARQQGCLITSVLGITYPSTTNCMWLQRT